MGRLENTHGLSQRNHSSRFIRYFAFFDVFAFGGSTFTRAASSRIAQKEKYAHSFLNFTRQQKAKLSRHSLYPICTVLYERCSFDGTVYIWKYSRNRTGQFRCWATGYTDYASQYR